LPPCPEPVADDCIPLATITVRRADCHIVQVCNWGPRKFAVTWPNLGYWLSWLPVGQLLHALIENTCCLPFREKDIGIRTAEGSPEAAPLSNVTGGNATTGGGTTMPQTSAQAFTTLLLESLTEKNRDRAIDAQTLALGVLDAVDQRGNPFMS